MAGIAVGHVHLRGVAIVEKVDKETTQKLATLQYARSDFDRGFLQQTIAYNNRIAALADKAERQTADLAITEMLKGIRSNATTLRSEATNLQWPYQLDFPIHGKM